MILRDIVKSVEKRNVLMVSGQQPKPFLFTKVARTASESMSLVFQNQCLNYIRLGRLPQCREWYLGGHSKDATTTSISHNHVPIPYLRASKVISDEWYFSRVKFAFVRNPWDRLVSYWRRKNYMDPIAKSCNTFTEFVHKCAAKRIINKVNPIRKSYVIYDSQWRWLLPDFDFIGRYEYLSIDWDTLNTKLNSKFVLNKHIQLHTDKGADRRHYTEYYDDSTAGLVGSMYEADCKLFGYDSIKCKTPHDSQTILHNLKAHWGQYE